MFWLDDPGQNGRFAVVRFCYLHEHCLHRVVYPLEYNTAGEVKELDFNIDVTKPP